MTCGAALQERPLTPTPLPIDEADGVRGRFDEADGERGRFDEADGVKGRFDGADGERGGFDGADGERGFYATPIHVSRRLQACIAMTAGPASAIIRHPLPRSRLQPHATHTLPDAGRPDRRCRELRAVTHRLPAAPLRVCVFGAEVRNDWLAAVAGALPPDAKFALFGPCADAGQDDARFARHPDIATDAVAVVRAAATLYCGDDLIALQTGTELPPYWSGRLLRALGESDVLVAAPLDNVEPTRSPLPEAACSDAAAQTIDALCHAYGRHQLLDWPTISPLLSAWSGPRLAGVAVDVLRDAELPAQFAPLRCVLLDHLYAAEPGRGLRGPEPVAPGADPVPPSALGELREQVGAALSGDAGLVSAHGNDFLPGLDTRPVVLHVLHGWGGGSERFVRDLAAGDTERHHLVLIARGNFPRRCYGEALELRDGALSEPPLRRLVLSNPIRSTAIRHRAYAAFLYAVTREFGVNAVIVSSLIGHSLDALRSGLPTLIVGHDFYPLWPLLHRDFGDAELDFDAAQLGSDLANAGAGFEFAERDPDYWRGLRDAYVDGAFAADAQLVAPSRSMLANLLRIEPRFARLPQTVIPHGLAPWPDGSPAAPQPPQRERLRLLVPGRVRSGKGAALLRAALPGLRRHAEVFLLGAGAEAEHSSAERRAYRAQLPAR